jgi:hypothetical protein
MELLIQNQILSNDPRRCPGTGQSVWPSKVKIGSNSWTAICPSPDCGLQVDVGMDGPIDLTQWIVEPHFKPDNAVRRVAGCPTSRF